MSLELQKLNHFKEFATDLGIAGVIAYINSGHLQFPEQADTNRKKDNYRTKFGPRSDFVVDGGNLFYRKISNVGLAQGVYVINLEVVRNNPAIQQQKIESVYNDITKGLGTGLNQFFQQVGMQFLNIKKKTTDAFLRKQGDYTVSRIPRKVINAPFVAKVPNERWGIDLVDMTSYVPDDLNEADTADFPKYILTVVDFFSGKCFARALKNRVLAGIRDKMQEICVENNTYPRIIQADGEFHKNPMVPWCTAHEIEFIKTTAYMPTSNGRTERMNREIRKKTKAGFIRNNNHEWVQYLDAYVQNINNQANSKTRLPPERLWIQGRQNRPPANPNILQRRVRLPRLQDSSTQAEVMQYGEAVQVRRARSLLASGAAQRTFRVGDRVRLSLLAIDTNMRKMQKEHKWNKMAVMYSPEVYIITAHHPQAGLNTRRETFEVKNIATNEPFKRGRDPRRFFASEMILQTQSPADRNTFVDTSIAPRTVARALEINKVPVGRAGARAAQQARGGGA
jgi:hypothetical protein